MRYQTALQTDDSYGRSFSAKWIAIETAITENQQKAITDLVMSFPFPYELSYTQKLGMSTTILAPVVGIEPTTRGFGDRRSTNELHRYKTRSVCACTFQALLFSLKVSLRKGLCWAFYSAIALAP
jgi:uncharacterized membrane protein